ncbi:ABC transporter ATP-binding protein [Kineosporia sp. A_224]|uniref:dipeptide ABC transporter ATP-binding protein n=1 Tax=Kineosporia sp. A_224 TaxID=1962180 RepID=UPI000B4BD933|nr:ABC transporter ATP-binding protein [Kineosporia sp. A_224]
MSQDDTTAAVATAPPPTEAGVPVARVEDLHVTFRRAGADIQAIRGVSLEVAPGEIVGLVGESGSGKSVLGLSLLGLLGGSPRTSGRAVVRGTDMLTAGAAERRDVRRLHLGAVFQDPMTSLNPTMRVGRQIVEAAGSQDEAVRLLTAVGVPDPARRLRAYPHELSGGLRQRVMIAMAVAGTPSLVIADEPTTALDVTVQAQVLGLVRRLRDEIGCAFLLVTHDLGVAAQVVDRVAVMYAGRITEVGPADEVLRNGAHPYGVALMRSRLSLRTDRDTPLLALPGSVPSPARPEPGCAFAPRCTLAGPDCTTTPPVPVEVAPGHLAACVRDLAEIRAFAAAVPAEEPPAAGTPSAATAPAAATAAGTDDAPVEEPAAVRVQNAYRTYSVGSGIGRRRPLQALRGVSLTVARGEAVAVVGESGSGKSTLLRLVAGLERADGGTIELGSAAGAQMVFQDSGASLTPWLTIGELVGERLRSAGVPRAERERRVAEALELVGLPAEVAKARGIQLSGGQRQRVGLARATVVPPEILLCDEPTSALDVSLAASVINLVGRLRRELDMAVLFVTHDLSVARVVADRIAVMYLGRIVEIGTADEITHRPRHPYTQALVTAVPDLGVEPPPPSGEPASPLDPPPGCAFHPRCPRATASCSDPGLDPRLAAQPGERTRLTACINLEVS